MEGNINEKSSVGQWYSTSASCDKFAMATFNLNKFYANFPKYISNFS
jgi:hypothetical protein